jgi:hypothetical protein
MTSLSVPDSYIQPFVIHSTYQPEQARSIPDDDEKNYIERVDLIDFFAPFAAAYKLSEPVHEDDSIEFALDDPDLEVYAELLSLGNLGNEWSFTMSLEQANGDDRTKMIREASIESLNIFLGNSARSEIILEVLTSERAPEFTKGALIEAFKTVASNEDETCLSKVLELLEAKSATEADLKLETTFSDLRQSKTFFNLFLKSSYGKHISAGLISREYLKNLQDGSKVKSDELRTLFWGKICFEHPEEALSAALGARDVGALIHLTSNQPIDSNSLVDSVRTAILAKDKPFLRTLLGSIRVQELSKSSESILRETFWHLVAAKREDLAGLFLLFSSCNLFTHEDRGNRDSRAVKRLAEASRDIEALGLTPFSQLEMQVRLKESEALVKEFESHMQSKGPNSRLESIPEYELRKRRETYAGLSPIQQAQIMEFMNKLPVAIRQHIEEQLRGEVPLQALRV